MARFLIGFVIGVAIARNAAPLPAPVIGTVLLASVLGAWFAYRFGGRDRATAVATAVAVAEARAAAAAEAQASAIAQAAVHLHLAQRDDQVATEGEGAAPARPAPAAIEAEPADAGWDITSHVDWDGARQQ